MAAAHTIGLGLRCLTAITLPRPERCRILSGIHRFAGRKIHHAHDLQPSLCQMVYVCDNGMKKKETPERVLRRLVPTWICGLRSGFAQTFFAPSYGSAQADPPCGPGARYGRASDRPSWFAHLFSGRTQTTAGMLRQSRVVLRLVWPIAYQTIHTFSDGGSFWILRMIF